ncbi:hypothetical protein GJAV_G00020050 [Gymnothorax javanicus]|nr:hypothetical protein GJAV_G00020050 [Gymnothorax javanicus]
MDYAIFGLLSFRVGLILLFVYSNARLHTWCPHPLHVAAGPPERDPWICANSVRILRPDCDDAVLWCLSWCQ